MGGSFGLVKGAQTRAAGELSDAAADCSAALTVLYDAIGSHAPGFRGMAANAFATALGNWADAGELLPIALSHDAQRLVIVDVTSAAADAAGAQATGEAASGLNLK